MTDSEVLLPAEAARRLGVPTRVVIQAMYEKRPSHACGSMTAPSASLPMPWSSSRSSPPDHRLRSISGSARCRVLCRSRSVGARSRSLYHWARSSAGWRAKAGACRATVVRVSTAWASRAEGMGRPSSQAA